MRDLLNLDESLDLSAMLFTTEQQKKIQDYIDDQDALTATIDAFRARAKIPLSIRSAFDAQ